ncbi:MAG TPA: hypothetical protein VNR40_14200, partial [Steroidobacter sp.]|nr:hypothetical protein [Steroidobacter sp.]
LTHNLHEFRTGISSESQYAQEFARWVHESIVSRDIESLLAYRTRAPHAQRAHPTEEHFLPLLIALGASAGTDNIVPIEGGMTYGVLSMDSYAWGIDQPPQARVMRNKKLKVAAPARLSENRIADICHTLQFTPPQERP